MVGEDLAHGGAGLDSQTKMRMLGLCLGADGSRYRFFRREFLRSIDAGRLDRDPQWVYMSIKQRLLNSPREGQPPPSLSAGIQMMMLEFHRRGPLPAHQRAARDQARADAALGRPPPVALALAQAVAWLARDVK